METYFGLPEEVKFCKRCVISNQRPNLTVELKHTIKEVKQTILFDDDGICDACKFHEFKSDGIDWEIREQEHRLNLNNIRFIEKFYNFCIRYAFFPLSRLDSFSFATKTNDSACLEEIIDYELNGVFESKGKITGMPRRENT